MYVYQTTYTYDVIISLQWHMCHVRYLQHLCGSFSRFSNNTPHHNGSGDEVKVTPGHTLITTVPVYMYVRTYI